MPEGVGYGAQFTGSIGKTLNYVGEHVYAYSGSIDNTGSANTLLSLETSGSYIIAKTDFVYFTESGSPDAAFTIKLNGVSIYALTLNGNVSDVNRPTIDIMIPPYSTLEILGQRISGSGTIALGAILSGKVYGKIYE